MSNPYTNLAQQPSGTPPGAGPNGSWVWSDDQWQYYDRDAGKYVIPSGPIAGSPPPKQSSLGLGSPGSGSAGQGGGDSPWVQGTTSYNQNQAEMATKNGTNPFGNQTLGAPSYTPFGVGGSGFGGYGGQGAFGGGGFAPYGNSPGYTSDSLVPTLEQLRMQRMTQAYPLFGGR